MKAVYKDNIIAESDGTEVVEGNHYFPPEAVNEDLLAQSDTEYTCPWKGDATYYHLQIEDEKVEDVAWQYPDTKEAAKKIEAYYAFDTSKVEVKQ